MRLIRTLLCKLLGISNFLEQTAHERALIKRIAQKDRLMQALKKQHSQQITDLNRSISKLQENLGKLQDLVDARDKEIEKLEHEKEVLQIDVKGMTSVNARLAKWVESLRIAEADPEHGKDLETKLASIESSMPWDPAT